MTESDILTMLKLDLQIAEAVTAYDAQLTNYITLAKQSIINEGIYFTSALTVDDAMLIEMYAAYLYRSRDTSAAMPRQLRWMLNNKLFKQKVED